MKMAPAVVFLCFFWVQSSAFADSAGNGYRVAVIKSRLLAPYDQAARGINDFLSRKDPSISVDFYELDGDLHKWEEISRELVQSHTNLLMPVGTEAAQAVLSKDPGLPVVTAMVYDPFGTEGVLRGHDPDRFYGAPLKISWEARFRWLKKYMPGWKRYAIIYRPALNPSLIEDVSVIASAYGLEIMPLPIESLANLREMIENAYKYSDALLMTLDRTIYNQATAKELFLFSARYRYPVISFSPAYVESGALMSFSVLFEHNGQDAARIAWNLLEAKMVAPHSEEPADMQITWNLSVAKTLGIELSPEAKREIDQFIEK
ncbi:MAG: hypothetical protein H6757_07025 [Candidatus Omnitrophica bacterium]|nr:hypothetical protein [Candidatus Omnitrophota bacterium]